MTAKQYIAACKSLGISPAYGAAAALGVSVASAQRYAKGTWPVPETVAKLLRALIEQGNPRLGFPHFVGPLIIENKGTAPLTIYGAKGSIVLKPGEVFNSDES